MARYTVHFIQNNRFGREGRYANALVEASTPGLAVEAAKTRIHFQEAFWVVHSAHSCHTKAAQKMIEKYGHHRGIVYDPTR